MDDVLVAVGSLWPSMALLAFHGSATLLTPFPSHLQSCWKIQKKMVRGGGGGSEQLPQRVKCF